MYICPMHSEVVSDQPGRCPKCGMRLVLRENASPVPPIADKGLGTLTWKNYLPLILIVGCILAATAIFSWSDHQSGSFSIFKSIGYFMTGFFLVFSLFKLLDIKGFAEGYSTYDLLAHKWFGYGYVYPFVELGFGLAMLTGIRTAPFLLAEIAVMAFSGLGVLIKILRREPVKCVCLGTVLKVPLTTVTLVEDFGMAALGLLLLLF